MRKVLPSELTNTIEQFIVYVHRNEAHFTYIYVYQTTNVGLFEADNIYKNPPPYVISPIFFAIFISLWAPPMTLLTAGALTDPQLPATALNVCTTYARLGGVGRVPRSSSKSLTTPVPTLPPSLGRDSKPSPIGSFYPVSLSGSKIIPPAWDT